MVKSQLVSVIVTTKNEEEVIERLILSIGRQTFKNTEIILVDNNSKDKTVEIVKNLGIRVYNFGPERSAQRNFGAKKAKGKYLLFIDADMELSRNVLNECVEVCKRDQNVGGVMIPEESIGKTFWGKVKAFERSFYNDIGDETTDAARFFTRDAFDKADGYDETITGPEDWDLSESVKKLDFKINRIKSKIYHYERINSPFDLAKKKFYYALAAHRYLSKQNIAIFSPKTIYFLRPVFYRNLDKIIKNPILAFGMIIMLSFELVGGGVGYLVGRIRKL